jgi:hypothetical protein
MKHFVLILAAMAVMGSQNALAQKKVVNLSAETTSMNVKLVENADQTVQVSRYLFAGYNTLCMPMTLSGEQMAEAVPGIKIERLATIRQEGSTLCLYFVDCTNEGIQAGMPYLIFSPTAKYLRVKNTDAIDFSTDINTVRMNDGKGNEVTFSSSWDMRRVDGLYGIPAKQNVEILESVLLRTTAEQAFRPTCCGFGWESQSATATSLEIKHVGSLSEVTGLKTAAAASSLVNVYDLKGHLVKKQVNPKKAKTSLPAGIYIIGGEKVTIK